MKTTQLSINFHSANYDCSYAKANTHYGSIKLEGLVNVELRLPDHAIRQILDLAAEYAVDQLAAASTISVHQIRRDTSSFALEHNPEVF